MKDMLKRRTFLEAEVEEMCSVMNPIATEAEEPCELVLKAMVYRIHWH